MHQSPSMSFLIHESAEEYHAKAKHYLSSHQLADFRKCPQLYYRKKTQPRTQEESPAYLVGRAAHVLILEGLERFREDFAVGGPINARTGQRTPSTRVVIGESQADGKCKSCGSKQRYCYIKIALEHYRIAGRDRKRRRGDSKLSKLGFRQLV